MEAVRNRRSRNRQFFVEGAGGTGKTFLYKCLYYSAIAENFNVSFNFAFNFFLQVLTVAQTGIAATLLQNGTTVHRQFAVPVNTTEDSECTIQPESALEKTLRETDVIIWDEATMSDKRVFECVHRALDDVCKDDNEAGLPFGGKVDNCFGSINTDNIQVMLLGGDWKQLLPVVRGTFGDSLTEYTLKASDLWPGFKVSLNKIFTNAKFRCFV